MKDITVIPDKQYFKIGAVSKIAKIKPYILRYWESEFDMIKPQKTKSNQRIYSKSDVELILEIKRLIYNEKFTLGGAKKRIKELQRQRNKQLSMNFPDKGYVKGYVKALKSIKTELSSIKRMLK
jgi:DNA-binding transcriptional MerR regulator